MLPTVTTFLVVVFALIVEPSGLTDITYHYDTNKKIQDVKGAYESAKYEAIFGLGYAT